MIESFNKKDLEAKIDQYVNGQLSAQEIDELWSELIQDGYHLDYLKSVANLKAVIKKRRAEQKAREARRYWYYAAAAVVTLLIAVMSFLNYSVQDNSEVKPISEIELNYYRSGDGSVSVGDGSEIIRNAIALANTGQVSEAVSLLENELETATEADWIAELSLNLGSLYYNQGKFQQAIEHYDKVISNKEHIDVLMLEKAYWYTGNAYFHLDQLSTARSYIEKAYDLNGAYRRVTQSYLNALSD